MVDHAEFERWQHEAGRALESSRLQSRAGLHNWACFAAEQAAQLAVKALLHGLGRGPWGHDLVRLGEAARESCGALWPERIEPLLRTLSRHYIPARYPDAHPEGSPDAHYGPEDAEEAIGQAEGVLSAIMDVWRQVVEAENES